MNAQQFFNLVFKMRAAQNHYFKDRTSSNLIEAKKLEKQVDDVLVEGLEPETRPSAAPETPTLFSMEDEQ